MGTEKAIRDATGDYIEKAFHRIFNAMRKSAWSYRWISLPDIRSSDGSLNTFNVLSMHHRILLQVGANRGAPVLQTYFMVQWKLPDRRRLESFNAAQEPGCLNRGHEKGTKPYFRLEKVANSAKGTR
jgi:hypothetical protein